MVPFDYHVNLSSHNPSAVFIHYFFIVVHCDTFCGTIGRRREPQVIRNLVLGNCGLVSLPKGTMWNRTPDSLAASPTCYRCTTTHRLVTLLSVVTVTSHLTECDVIIWAEVEERGEGERQWYMIWCVCPRCWFVLLARHRHFLLVSMETIVAGVFLLSVFGMPCHVVPRGVRDGNRGQLFPELSVWGTTSGMFSCLYK